MRRSEISPAAREVIEMAEQKLNSMSKYTWRINAIVVSEDRVMESRLKDIICNVFNVFWYQVEGKSRKREFVDARHTYFYFCYKFLGFTAAATGENLKGRDHTTVLHAVTKIKDLIHSKDGITDNINQVKKQLFETSPNKN